MAQEILPENSSGEGQGDEFDAEVSKISNDLMKQQQEPNPNYEMKKEVEYNTPEVPTKEIKKRAILMAKSKIKSKLAPCGNISPVIIREITDDIDEVHPYDSDEIIPHPNDPNKDDDNDLKMDDKTDSSKKSSTNIGAEGMNIFCILFIMNIYKYHIYLNMIK